MNAIASLDPRFSPLSADSFPDLLRRLARMADLPGLRMDEDIRVDVTETDKDYFVKAELPGVAKEDVRVHVDGNYVAISAMAHPQKKEARKHDGERTLLHETHDGMWSRGISLPREIEDKAADARFDNGVLSLRLPKRQPASGKTVAIK
ncbi:MAG TPA: Hsp20/alpha crystallin family protein [Burkholderiaceae bacterium]